MKVIMVMYDTLCRRFLPNYGCDWTIMPNFKRLGDLTVTFDNFWAGSLATMPARREMHTGRYNLLHRSWGPLEPYDDSVPEILKKNGVYVHFICDNYHYWEDGGSTYHERYNTWEIFRGQEGDPWKGELADPEIPEGAIQMVPNKNLWRQDWINRKHMPVEEEQPQYKVFQSTLEFMEKNHDQDNWFLWMETFDPHEPFYTPRKYKDLYPHEYSGPHFDWPSIAEVKEPEEYIRHAQCEYAALLSMCDNNLGKILDTMDKYNMWDDTMLIVNTDHGCFLGEHGYWAKARMPFYNEISHIPFFVWDPRSGKKGERRDALVQTMDFAPTILNYFGMDIPKDVQASDIKDTIASNKQIRKAGLFGTHGGHVNVTDGRYVYMRAPKNAPSSEPLFNYTHMATNLNDFFPIEDMRDMELAPPFSFTKGCPTMKVRRPWNRDWNYDFTTKLFDLKEDYAQEKNLNDPGIEKMMTKHLTDLMKWNDAPPEQYERLGIKEP
jgi:arylsulfatase A-like enzyme